MNEKRGIADFDLSGFVEDTPKPRVVDKKTTTKAAQKAAADSGFIARTTPKDKRNELKTDRQRGISLKVTELLPDRLDSVLHDLRADSRGHALELLLEHWLATRDQPECLK